MSSRSHIFASFQPKALVGASALLLALVASCGSQNEVADVAPSTSEAVATIEDSTTSIAPSRTLMTVASTIEPTTTTEPATTIEPTITTEPATTTVEPTTTTSEPTAALGWVLLPSGRQIPTVPESAEDFARALNVLERHLRTPETAPVEIRDLGHGEQILVRALTRRDDKAAVVELLDSDTKWIIEAHLNARAELGALHTAAPIEQIPNWKIVEPAPQADLLAFYQSASEATGIEWQILAAINLVETGLGRIQGLSTAGARGPMQFLPTTWVEVSQGGDIDDPEDAIHGAARYLVRRGGLDDIRKGLWGYNNSDHYVNAVLEYAALIKADPAAFDGLYGWEIYVGSASGTLWLPSGQSFESPTSAADYLAAKPWVKTLG